jgi:polyisoprenoid-binding protein YceI
MTITSHEGVRTITARPQAKKRHFRRWWPHYVVVAMLATGAATYLLLFTPLSVAELSLDDTPANAPIDADDLSGEWSPGDGSVAGYRVREQLAMLPAPSDAVGRTSTVTGTIEIEDDGSSIAALPSSVIEVDLTTLQSDESRRDDHIRTSGLETDAYPTTKFELTDDIVVPEAISDGSTVNADAQGDLTLHGVTRSVTIPLQIRLSGDSVEIVGSQVITLSDYEIDVSAFGGFVSVEDEGTIEFELSLTR